VPPHLDEAQHRHHVPHHSAVDQVTSQLHLHRAGHLQTSGVVTAYNAVFDMACSFARAQSCCASVPASVVDTVPCPCTLHRPGHAGLLTCYRMRTFC
jgi:hypothetical protein